MKRKAINEDVTKNDLAYHHWRNQIKICEAHLVEKFEIEKKLKNEILDLNDDLEDDIASLKYKYKKKIDLIQVKREENQEIMDNFEKKLKIAKVRCQHPFFKNLSRVFPLVILQLLVEYNSLDICSECTEAYVPRFSHCWYGHEYTCESSVVPELGDFNEVIWNNTADQTIWDNLLEMVNTKATKLGQMIDARLILAKDWKDLRMKIVISANCSSLRISGGIFPFIFRITNEV